MVVACVSLFRHLGFGRYAGLADAVFIVTALVAGAAATLRQGRLAAGAGGGADSASDADAASASEFVSR